MSWYFKVLKNYANFSDRAQRMEYWMFFLFNFLIVIILSILAYAFFMIGIFTEIWVLTIVGGVFYGIILLYTIATFIPNIAVHVRRLHDTDRSGWWFFCQFLLMIPAIIGYSIMIPGLLAMESGGEAGIVLLVVGAIITGISVLVLQGIQIACFVFYCFDGTPGDNRFGPNPKEVLD